MGGDRLGPGTDVVSTLDTTGAPADPAGPRRDAPAAERDPRVGRFALTRRLGAGGMGEVYAARDPELDRQIAIKLLRPGLSTRADARLRREARAMARLSHRNLITVHDVGVHDGRLFIAMELIAGQTLRSWVAGRPWRDVVRAFVAAGRGLAAAHGARIVHRDFKPDNVLVGDDGRVAVGDFGIARTGGDEPGGEAAAGDERLTQVGALLGTLRYMAPEQLERRTADARSDQFAFCVALWEALDRDPFDRGAPPADAEARRDAITTGPAPGPLPGVPPRIRRALVRGLAIDPAARWPELTALLDELDAATTRRGRLAVPAVAGAAAVAVAIAAAWGLRAPPSDPCATAGDLAGVWGAGDVDRLAAAFAATGRPDATDAAHRVVELLDRRAARWSASRTAACRAIGRGDDALTPLYRRQAACLDDQRRELAALVHRLTAQPTGEVVDRSVRTVSRLAPAAACDNLEALRGQPAPPATPGADRRIDELTAALADARVEAELGRDAPDRLAALERDAEAVGWAPLIARAAYLAGQRAHHRLDPAVAEAKLRAAALAAARAHDDALVARASALAAEMLVDADRPREAVELARAAEVACARAGDPPDLRARALAALATADVALSKFDDADRLYGEAIRLLDSSRADPLDLADLTSHWANSLFERSDYARALPLSSRAVDMLRRLEGDHHPDVARALANHGNLLVAVGKYAEARARYDEALAIKQALFGPDDPTVAQTLNSLGNLAGTTGDLERAAGHYQRALDIFTARLGPDHSFALMVRYNLGVNLRHLGKPAEARAALEDVLARRRAAAEPSQPKIANTLDALAGVYDDLGDHARAIDVARRALAIRERVLGPDTGDVADSLARLAGLWAARGDCAQARPAAERALAIVHKEPDGGGVLAASPTLALAACDALAGRGAAAIAGYRSAIAMFPAQTEDRAERGQARLALADLVWPTDRAEARALATAAAADLAPRPAAANAWLAAHR